ncbi:GGDEF domain-containing protein [Acidaminobacter sp. JC074]|uniref:GGDEF domain-containing protein n=1 Tax=Acidaminobacter sp. JC074 TaxID=2530199 RepID=UPI001F0F9414|nr:diguanylate cyclase [Acidaminobacter sp. JC074]
MIDRKNKDEKFLEYILKENFNLILVFCSLYTVYILLSIAFGDFDDSFISNATVILIMFLLLTLSGIWVQHKHNHQIRYYKLLIGAFYMCTIIAIILSDIGETSSYLFIFSGLMLLLMFSGYLYISIVLRTPLLISILGSCIFLTIKMSQSNLYIVVSIVILFYSLLVSHQRYQSINERYNNRIQIKEMKERLEILSYKDILTDLYNNHYIHEQLDHEINRSVRYQTPLCLLILDIDNFERYNQEHGQLAGDDALSIIGNILLANCRSTDIIGRYSGEEFIAVLPNTSLDESILLAERLRLLIHKYDYGHASDLTVSVGIKEYIDETSSQLVKATIKNVQLAKKLGYNNIYYDKLGGEIV